MVQFSHDWLNRSALANQKSCYIRMYKIMEKNTKNVVKVIGEYGPRLVVLFSFADGLNKVRLHRMLDCLGSTQPTYLALSQTKRFRLFQTERVCRR